MPFKGADLENPVYLRKQIDELLGATVDSPEFNLWSSVVAQAVADAYDMFPREGRQFSVKEDCEMCHHDHCGELCFGWDERIQNIRRRVYKWGANLRCSWKPHSIQQCALNYLNGPLLVEDCDKFGVDVSYFKRRLENAVKRGLLSEMQATVAGNVQRRGNKHVLRVSTRRSHA